MYKNLKKLEKQVWVLPGFIESDDLEKLNSSVNLAASEDWFKDGSPKESFWYGRSIHKELLGDEAQLIIGAIEENLTAVFEDYTRIHEIQSVLRTTADGVSLGKHQDNSAQGDETNIFGVVVYLNNDYEGGEIFYEDLGIQYKPEPGDLVVHYAGLTHGVAEVVSGERFVLTSFVKGTKDTKFLGDTVGI